MRTVWKFSLRLVDGWQVVDIPLDAIPVRFGMQGDSPQLWAMVDTDKPSEPRRFAVESTSAHVIMGCSCGTCSSTSNREIASCRLNT